MTEGPLTGGQWTEGPLTEGPLTEGPLTEGPLTGGQLKSWELAIVVCPRSNRYHVLVLWCTKIIHQLPHLKHMPPWLWKVPQGTAAQPASTVRLVSQAQHMCELVVGCTAQGIEIARRDNCPAVVKLMEATLRILFTTKDLSQVRARVHVCA